MQLFVLPFKRLNFYWIGLFWVVNFSLQADIVTDGTVGSAQTLLGPNFSIPETLGSRSGANLFHSFQRFNINSGEQATFTGSANIRNVISRVTGGQISNINGLLRSTIGQADFYFLNPAGVVFGANAQIDVPASFYLSTADELRFADGSIYSATNPAASTLTIASPEAFGFLGNQTANITLQQSNLGLTSGSTLAFSSSEIQIDSAQIQIDAGEVQLAAIGKNAMEVTVSGEVSTPALGDLNINNSIIDVNGAGAGRIIIRSGASQINGSTVSANNVGAIDASLNKGIDVKATSLQIANSLISTDSFGLGRNAANISLSATGKLSISNVGSVRSLTASVGDAGNILINAGEILIDNGAGVFNAVLAGAGSAGEINVITDGTLSLLNGGLILSNTTDSNYAGKLFVQAKTIELENKSSISSGTTGSGSAAVIEITAIESINLVNGSGIRSTGQINSTGNVGNVSIVARNLTINGQAQIGGEPAFLGSVAKGDGDAGIVQITVEKSIKLLNLALISTATFFNGKGGEINISANTLTLNGNGFTTGISSSTAGSNDAGKVVIDVSNLNIIDTAGIESGAQDISHLTSLINHPATGNAGQITIHADNIMINDGTITIDTDVILTPDLIPLIKLASINIDSQNISLINASITTESTGNVPAGSITLNVAGTLSIDPSTISTAANNANGGAILINANVIDLQDSQITTSVTGQGNGGDISLNSNILILDSGFIQANTTGSNVQGGDIQINTQALITSQGLIQTGGGTPLSFQPGLNVIQAAAPDGVSGNITITSPQLNISGDLTDLETALLDVDQLAKNPCMTAGGRQSRLASLGHGGLAETPEQAGSVTVTSERLEQLLTTAEYQSEQSSISDALVMLSAYSDKECG